MKLFQRKQQEWVNPYNDYNPQREAKEKISPLAQSKKIYINGIKFEGPWVFLTGADLCRMVFVPIDNASIENEDGKHLSIYDEIPIQDGQHYAIMRRSVTGS